MNITVFEPGDVSLSYYQPRFDGAGSISIKTPVTIGGGGGEDNSYTTLSAPILTGSLYFDGSVNGSTATINQWGGFNFETGPFTIEWWQYEAGENHGHVRPWYFGSYPTQSMGVSFEGGTFYLWAPNAFAIGSLGTYKNQWVHFAITRLNGQIKVFKNGTQIGSTLSNTNYISHTTDLTLGNEQSPSIGSQFGGYMTNFHIMLAAKYTSNFTPNTSGPIPKTTKSILLLDCDDSGNATKDYTGINSGYTSNVTWNSAQPF